MEMQQQAYSVAEAAAVLRVSPWLIREACRRGEIRSLRLGKRVIIPRDAIDQFLAAAPDEGSAADS